MTFKTWKLTGPLAAIGVAVAALTSPAFAQKKYDTGATDKEIKIGGISPYSGPASAYGAIGKAIGAYFDKVNAEGGINGRKLNWISLDDGYNPAKTVEMARKLGENDRCQTGFWEPTHRCAVLRSMLNAWPRCIAPV